MKKILLLIILWNFLWIGAGVYGLIEVLTYVDHHGLKALVDKVWNGDGK